MFAIDRSGRVLATKKLRAVLEKVQFDVNQGIHYQTDFQTYGEIDRWSYPKLEGFTLVGDCEDYCLYKRQALIDQGVPSSALLLTICTDPHKQGHCVLSVVTDRFDYILCNLHPYVATPEQMRVEGFTFLYRQQLGKGISEPWDILTH